MRGSTFSNRSSASLECTFAVAVDVNDGWVPGVEVAAPQRVGIQDAQLAGVSRIPPDGSSITGTISIWLSIETTKP